MTDPLQSAAAKRALLLGSAATRIFGLTPEERLRRLFVSKGIALVGSNDGEDGSPLIGFRGDLIFEETIVANLLATPGTILCLDDDTLVAFHVPGAHAALAKADLEARVASDELRAATRVVRPKDLAYNVKLRKRATPYVLAVSDGERDAIERTVFAGSYKGVTDIATKFLFPWIVRQLTSFAAALGLRPNTVTFVGFVLTVVTTYLFHEGRFGLGIATGWAMCVLDSVDGKLARTTLTSSKLGDVFDHAIDLIHPPFWYWAFMVGLGPSFTDHPYGRATYVSIMVLYIGQRLLEGLFIKLFGVEMHIWRPFDSQFRLITARRNPNLLILTAAVLVGRPLEGILTVGAWTVASFVVHLVQVVQASIVKARGERITSWLTMDVRDV